MSGRVCYISRTDSGDRILSIRLVGGSVDETWHAPPDAADDDPAESSRDAARWMRRVLSDLPGRSGIDLICVDASGSLLGWLRSEGRDDKATETLVRSERGEVLVGSIAGADGLDDFGESEPESGVSLLPDLSSGGATVLASRPTEEGSENDADRVIVLAMRDACVRIFLDELDRKGVPVGSVQSIWHGLASAWDPSSPVARRLGERESTNSSIVAESSGGCTAIVLADPVSGRASWSWSDAGKLLAGGSMLTGGGEDDGLDAADLARLEADWMAWSIQLGMEPQRVVVVMPPSDFASGVGARLGELRPSASIDVVSIEDPLGSTLDRLGSRNPMKFASPADPARSVTTLAALPGRAHRSMFIFAALGMLGLAAALGVWSWQLLAAASDDREEVTAINREIGELYQKHDKKPLTGQIAALELRKLAGQRRESFKIEGPPTPSRPVLPEMLELAFLFSAEAENDIEVVSITLEQIRGTLQLVMPADIGMYEDFRSSLNNLDTSNLLWNVQYQTSSGDYRVTAEGDWK